MELTEDVKQRIMDQRSYTDTDQRRKRGGTMPHLDDIPDAIERERLRTLLSEMGDMFCMVDEFRAMVGLHPGKCS